MNCVGKGTYGTCGHSVTEHEGDESGMGGPEPCMVDDCGCEGFVRAPQPGNVLMTRNNLPSSDLSAIQQNSNTFAVSIPEGIIETKTIVTFYPKEKK